MNLVKKSALLSIILITFLAGRVVESQQVLADYGITVKSNEALIIRSGPGTEYTVLGTLEPNTSVLALGRNNYSVDSSCSEQWINVLIVEGFDGWITACTLEGDSFPFEDRPLTNLQIVEPTFPILVGNEPQIAVIEGEPSPIEFPNFATWTQGELVVRQQPGLGNTPLGIVPAGETVEMIQQLASGAWVQIRYRGVVGWVLRENLHIGPLQEGLPIYVPPPPSEEIYADDIDERGVMVDADGRRSDRGGKCRYEYRFVNVLRRSSGSAYNYGYAGSTYVQESRSVLVCD